MQIVESTKNLCLFNFNTNDIYLNPVQNIRCDKQIIFAIKRLISFGVNKYRKKITGFLHQDIMIITEEIGNYI